MNTDHTLNTMPSDTPRPVQLIIEPSKGWSSLRLGDIWEYRDLLYFMVWRDLKARYRQTALGPLWIVLQPLMSMVLYTVVFGAIAQLPSEGKPYAVFTYVALLPWTFFSQAVSASSDGLLANITLMSKVYFPRLISPLATIVSSLVDLAISFVILFGLLVYFGIVPNWGVVLIPFFLLLAAITGMGFGLLFAGIIVRFRDVGQLLGYIMRLWMYATPVVYSIDVVPEQWQWFYRLNPITQVVEGFRWALLGTGQPPNPVLMLISTGIALAMFFGGLYAFKRAERNIVDVA
jgi:lipopolysaccharide transport system permease protein